jgi:hypothetical protein
MTHCSSRSEKQRPRCWRTTYHTAHDTHHGEQVVKGRRMMLAASDIFLGWTTGRDVSRHFYWRQLRDMKGSALVEAMAAIGLTF